MKLEREIKKLIIKKEEEGERTVYEGVRNRLRGEGGSSKMNLVVGTEESTEHFRRYVQATRKQREKKRKKV